MEGIDRFQHPSAEPDARIPPLCSSLGVGDGPGVIGSKNAINAA